jgi:hypothetical protein
VVTADVRQTVRDVAAAVFLIGVIFGLTFGLLGIGERIGKAEARQLCRPSTQSPVQPPR